MDESQWLTPKETRLKQLRKEWFYLEDGLEKGRGYRSLEVRKEIDCEKVQNILIEGMM